MAANVNFFHHPHLLLKGPANYSTWKIGFSRRLMEDKLWGYVDGTIVAGETEPQKAEFKERDQSALNKIILALEPELYTLVSESATSKIAWEILEATFERSGTEHAILIRNEMSMTRYENFNSMYEFLKKMFEFRQQLKVAGSEVTEREFILNMFGKLPEKFDMIVTTLQNMAKFPTFDVVYNKLLQEEAKYQARELEKGSSGGSENVLYLRNRGSSYRGRGSGNFHQERRGPVPFNNRGGFYGSSNAHQERRGAVTINGRGGNYRGGYQRGAANSSSQYRQNYQDVECYNCHKKGHLARNCRNNNNKQTDSTERSKALTVIERISSVSTTQDDRWILDSGATCHVSFKQPSEDIRYTDSELIVADGSIQKSTLKGTAVVKIKEEEGDATLRIKNVTYAPTINANLLSVPKITSNGNDIYFTKGECFIFKPKDKDEYEKFKKNHEGIATAARENDLYVLDTTVNEKVMMTTEKMSESKLWHLRLAHLNQKSMKLLCHEKGINSKIEDYGDCYDCAESKLSRSSFPKAAENPEKKLAIVASDVCGPMPVESFGGNRYFITFTDLYSRYSYIFMMKNKSEAFDKFKIYKQQAERQTGEKIKVLRSDNGREYVNNEFKNYLQELGIIHHPK